MSSPRSRVSRSAATSCGAARAATPGTGCSAVRGPCSSLWTAVTSFWIRDINEGAFSWLHVLSVVTLVTVTLGVVNARRGRIQAHRGNMVGSWLGAVGAMLAATAIPGRMIPTYAVAEPGGAVAFALSVLVMTVLLVLAGARLARVVDGRAARRTEAVGIRA